MEKKKECEIVQDLLLGYVDNTLNETTKKVVEKHLLECEECQKRLTEIKKDIAEHENNQKKEIDYLKKLRRKNRIKSIIMAFVTIIVIAILIYIYKLIIITNIVNKAEETLKSNNLYKETRQIIGRDKVSIIKYYYKDGKYKKIDEIYTEEGAEIINTEYTTVDSDETYSINEKEKTVIIQKGDFTKMMNSERNLKFVPHILDVIENDIIKFGIAFTMSITTDNYQSNKEYYVIKNQFEKTPSWELCIDKETGLPIKETNFNSSKIHFAGTDIVKEVRNDEQEYIYKFNIVTDEDVKMPDLTGYEKIYNEDEIDK